MLNKLLRQPYRKLLIKVTKKVLEKHKPTIIAVMGDGQTAVARELVYEVVKAKHAARRNLESPDAEFSLPLTILGYNKYPKSYFEWLWVLIKSNVSVQRSKPYDHFLILEINFVIVELLDFWMEILSPETILIVGKIPTDYSKYEFKKVVKISSIGTEDPMGPFKIAAKQIGRFYQIEDNEIEQVLQNINLPSSKIRYFPGVNESFVIDATHYFFPIDIGSVLELIYGDEDPGRKILLTDSRHDTKAVEQRGGWLVNPKDLIPQKDDLIVIRGERVKKLEEFGELFASNRPLL